MTNEHNPKPSKISIELANLLRNRTALPGDTGQSGDTCVRKIDWLCKISGEVSRKSDKKIELLVEARGGESQLATFKQQLDELIHDMSEEFGGIMSCNTLWERTTCITILLEPGRMSELMMQMAFMTDVERVEEGLLFGEKPAHTGGLFGISPYPMNSRDGNKIKVVLKEALVLGY